MLPIYREFSYYVILPPHLDGGFNPPKPESLEVIVPGKMEMTQITSDILRFTDDIPRINSIFFWHFNFPHVFPGFFFLGYHHVSPPPTVPATASAALMA